MVGDEVSIAARNDRVIMKIGEKLYQKHGHLPHLYTHISQKIRELGRFLICVRKQDADINCMTDILAPEKFPVPVTATKVLCKFDEVNNHYSSPSLALKIGHLLKKCAKLSKSESLINGSVEQGNKADGFLTLCENEWTDEISSSALQTLTTNKMNKGQMLPLSGDIMQLQSYFHQNTESLSKALEDRFDKSEWELLNQMTLAQLVMFNRRRGGETQRKTVEAYVSRMQNTERPPKEVDDALSATEKNLVKTMSRVEIRGKKGRTVPVLLTQTVQKCIDLLLKWRNEAGVAEENKYVFARPNFGSLEALRSSDVLRYFAKEVGLTKPENITSTSLRKHVATVAQVLNLDRNDLEIMASFMGHDITVHQSFYRLPQETLQVARMGRLLTAFNNGTIGQYSGMSLDDISLHESDDENEEMSSEEDDQSDESFEHQDYTTEGPSVVSHPKFSDALPKSKLKQVQKLIEEQSSLLKKLFQTNVALRRELRREDCEKAINKYPILKGLTWQKIKNTIHNWITLEKRKTMKLAVN